MGGETHKTILNWGIIFDKRDLADGNPNRRKGHTDGGVAGKQTARWMVEVEVVVGEGESLRVGTV